MAARNNLMLYPMTPMVQRNRGWLDVVRNNKPSGNPGPKIGAIDVLLNSGVAGATGVILGAADLTLKDGLDFRGIAIDGASAAILQVMAYALNSPTALVSGNVAFGIYSFRQTKKLLTMMPKKEKPAVTITGEDSEATVENDSIVALGKDLEINPQD